ncbi:MAG: DUF3311 domain-containing protein [Phycisphaerae bacterium]|nr:DUF3311 domain-containing protein [Phycisphaerae bacterium]
MKTSCCSGSTRVVWILALVLLVVHQDWWWWDDRTLVFGFLPIGLFYHGLFSLAAAAVWAAAVKFAWPHHLERWADELEDDDAAESQPPAPASQP